MLFPTPKRAHARAGRADAVRRLARRAAAQGRRDLGPDRRAAPDLQRLLGRRRRDRPSSSTSTTACRADYEELERRGIDVKGKIVIARYGGSWRGIKPKVAAEHGAVGCLIYSDPRDDGYFQGDVYPNGGWRSDRGAQRGSVVDMPIYPGDPLTPGVGATKDAKRLDRSRTRRR